jgi:hypothetical protein
MPVYYLPTEPTMHTEEWPARRCSGPSCNQGRRECATPDACRVSSDEPASRRDACSPMIGVIVGSALGALAVALFVWLVATALRVA